MIKFSEMEMEKIREDVVRECGIMYLLNAENMCIRDILYDLETIYDYIGSFHRLRGFNEDDEMDFIQLLQKNVYYEDNIYNNSCVANEALVNKILSVDVKTTMTEELNKAHTEYKLRCEEIYEKYEPVLKPCKDCAADLDAESKDGRCSLCIEAKDMYELRQKFKSVGERIMENIDMDEVHKYIELYEKL